MSFLRKPDDDLIIKFCDGVGRNKVDYELSIIFGPCPKG